MEKGIVLLLLLLLCLMLANCTGPGTAVATGTDTETARYNTQTILHIGVNDFPPYEIVLENGQVTGLTTEVVESVFRAMKVTAYDIKPYPWMRAMAYLQDGTLQGVYTMGINPERATQFAYPGEPIILSKWVFFIRKEDQEKLKFTSFEDLRGKRIGVIRGYKYTPEFWDFLEKEQNYEEVTTDEQNFKKLAAGRLDYVACEYGVGRYLAKKLGISTDLVALTDKSFDEAQLYIVFNKQTVPPDLVKTFSATLKLFKTTPEYRAIVNKYLGQ